MEFLESSSTTLVRVQGQSVPALCAVNAHQGRRRLLASVVVGQAGFPGVNNGGRTGPPEASGAIARHLQTGILPEQLELFPRPSTQSANGSSSSSADWSANASRNLLSRSKPGSAVRASRSFWCTTRRSTSSSTAGLAQIRARSDWSRAVPASPRTDKASRAYESACERAFLAAAGSSLGKSASMVSSLPTRRPGLSRTSSHSRLLGGRRQGPATFCPILRENCPSSVAWRGAVREQLPSPSGGSTDALSHGLCRLSRY